MDCGRKRSGNSRSVGEDAASSSSKPQQNGCNRSSQVNERVAGRAQAIPITTSSALAQGRTWPGSFLRKGSRLDGFFLDSERGREVLYYLGQHPKSLRASTRNLRSRRPATTSLNPMRHSSNSARLMEIEAASFRQRRRPAKLLLPLHESPRPLRRRTRFPAKEPWRKTRSSKP